MILQMNCYNTNFLFFSLNKIDTGYLEPLKPGATNGQKERKILSG